MRSAHKKLTILGLFRGLLGKVLGHRILEGRGAQDSWLIFKAQGPPSQKLFTKRKLDKSTGTPAWTNNFLLDKPKHKGKPIEGKIKDRYAGKNMETLSEQPGIRPDFLLA